MGWAEDCEAIRQTIACYCKLLDDQRFEALADLFAEDAVLPWEGRTLVGREAIRRDLPSTQRPKGTTRHLPISPVIDVRGEGASRTALAWTDTLVTVHPPEEPAVIAWTGRYYDAFAVENERWLMTRHVAISIDEERPADAEPVPGRRPGPL